MMMTDKTISVVVPAFNEEANIRLAIQNVLDVLKKNFKDFEILAFDDGSRDQTGRIIDELSRSVVQLKAVHHSTNLGLGVILRESFAMASKDYVVFSSGDNSIHPKSFENLITAIGKADVIIGYMLPVESRAWIRKFFTTAYTQLMNVLFGLHLKYFNGPTVYPTKDVRGIALVSTRYDCFSEMLIRVLKSGKSYCEVAFEHDSRNDRNSKAFSLRNILSGIKTLCVLFWDIRVRRKPKG